MSIPKSINSSNFVNYYEVLGITRDCNNSQITRAYRKRALECHPDKNPDNPKAAIDFQNITIALEVLLNENSRKALNQYLDAKFLIEEKNKKLDGERRKFKDDLEYRESVAAKNKQEDLANEITKLRAAGSNLVKEQQRIVEEFLKKNMKFDDELDMSDSVIVKWTNDFYDKTMIESMFTRYGKIIGIHMKKNCAVVEFSDKESAIQSSLLENGIKGHEMTVSIVKKNSEVKEEQTTKRKAELPSNTFSLNEDDILEKMRRFESNKTTTHS